VAVGVQREQEGRVLVNQNCRLLADWLRRSNGCEHCLLAVDRSLGVLRLSGDRALVVHVRLVDLHLLGVLDLSSIGKVAVLASVRRLFRRVVVVGRRTHELGLSVCAFHCDLIETGGWSALTVGFLKREAVSK